MTKLTSSSSQREKETGLIKAFSSLKNQIKQQHKLINALLDGINYLNLAKDKSKSPLVKDAIDVVIDAAESINANRPLLYGAFYEPIQRQPERVHSRNQSILCPNGTPKATRSKTRY